MKTKALVSLTVLLLAAVLLALPAPVQATAPEQLIISAEMYLTGETSAAGTFTTSGLFVDSGAAVETYFVTRTTIHGVKTLTAADGSTITIKFQARLSWSSPTDGVAKGRFTIISGTGRYARLHGVGTTYAALDLTKYQILATYKGKAHFD